MPSFIYKFFLRLALLVLGFAFLPKLIYGVVADSFFTLLAFAILLSVVDRVLRPLLGLIALPVNMLTLGLFSRILMAVLILVILMLGFNLLPGLSATSTTMPQHIQAVLAYWVMTLTVLAITR